MSRQTINETGTEFTITRTFSAPLATVWDVWTRPEHFENWFHAVPGSVRLDVRDGGPWQATMQTPAGEMTMSGVYRQVVEQEKLVWTLEGPGEPVVMSAKFAEQGPETVVVYGQNLVGGYTCEQSIEGAAGILDSFERHLDEETR